MFIEDWAPNAVVPHLMPDDHHAHCSPLLCEWRYHARVALIGFLGLFADEWPRSSPAMLRKGKPASFRLFPVGSYVVVCSAGSFLPTLVGLLKGNTLVRLPSCVPRSLDAFHEGFRLRIHLVREPLLGCSAALTWKPRRERLRRGFFMSIRLMTLRCGKSHMLMPRAG